MAGAPVGAEIADDSSEPAAGAAAGASDGYASETALTEENEGGARAAFDDRHRLWYDQTYPSERLLADWRLLAERYLDVPNVIGADLYNEPHDEACWGCGDPAVDWKAAAEEAGDAVHEIEPDWLVFVEGVENAAGESCHSPDPVIACAWWGADLSRAADDPVELDEPDKVVYAPHDYATSVHRQPWFDDADFPANLPAIWDGFWGDLARDEVAPVMVGEFGTTLDAPIDAVWLDSLLGYLDEIGAGFTFWSFNPNSGDTGGLLEDDWTTVDEDKYAALEPHLVGPFPPAEPRIDDGDVSDDGSVR